VARARSNRPDDCPYVTKGGLKLEYALGRFSLDVTGLVAADLGCHRGGFTDCLLQRGAGRVHSVDTAYGILDWKLRNDPRVFVHERTNLLHWSANEPVDLAVIDGGWTPQRLSVPAALRCLKPDGRVLSLVKAQYEAPRALLRQGVLPPDSLEAVMRAVRESLPANARIEDEAESPILGSGGNVEKWLLIRPA
jgi:23S rRNA (cytidine1920-2'-O)/16S rRNA (cytidine1409-2'-O)-methyltransferase